MTNFLEQLHYKVISGGGDWASIVGVGVVLIGFVITIYNVRRSRQIVARVRMDIRRRDSVVDFSGVITTMEEIRRLHRERAWAILPDRYAALRKALVSIRASDPDLSEDEKTTLQNTLQHFRNIEKQVEKVLDRDMQIDIVHINTITSKQIDTLNEILNNIKLKIGR